MEKGVRIGSGYGLIITVYFQEQVTETSMKKNVFLAVVFASFVVSAGYVMAGEGKGKGEGKVKGDKAAVALEDITLTGKISKTEAGKAGVVHFVLTDAEGNKIKLPKAVSAKGGEGEGAAVIKLEDFVDAQVEVVGKGRVEEKEGKKVTVLKSVSSVKKVEAKAEEVKKDEAAPAAK